MDTSSEEKRNLYSLNQSIRMLSTFSKWCCANSDMTDNPFSIATEKGLKREEVPGKELRLLTNCGFV